MEIDHEKVMLCITEDYVQQQANGLLGRELTPEELEEVGGKILENTWRVDGMINESIEEVMAFNELVEMNEGAETKLDHFLLYWKNENAYQKEYVQIFAALTEQGMHEYIEYLDSSKDDLYKISKVNAGTETEIELVSFPLKTTSTLTTDDSF